jgi:hypothetical protein
MGKLEVASARGGECGTVGLTVATDDTLDATDRLNDVNDMHLPIPRLIHGIVGSINGIQTGG